MCLLPRVITAPSLGFIGLGTMGEPMALNLLKAGQPLTVWNRSDAKRDVMAAAGASIAEDSEVVFARCGVVILMLSDGAAIDAVLGRGSDAFGDRVASRTIVNMGTVEPAYSRALDAHIHAST